MITGIKKKGLSSIVSAIILIVVIVILVTIILSWGREFTLKGTEETKIIFEETKDYLISNPILQDNYLAFKNISANNKSVTIVGYKILSTSEDSNFNSDIMLDEPIVINPGATGIISLIKLPSERKMNVELLTEDNKKIILNINNTNSSSEESEEDQEPQISSEKNIIYFTIDDTNGTIDSDLNTITFEFAYGTDITALTPTITISDDATISPESGVSQNFTNPLEYTVTAEDASTKTYTVIITFLDIPVPDGIEEIPINGEIWYLEHLDYIDTNSETLSETYTLMRDLNFDTDSSYYNVDNKATWTTGEGWMPLGTSATKFTGIFDGNNYKINNLYINRPTTDYVGLFGYTTGSGVNISNLELIDANVIGQNYVGSLGGYLNYGTFSNNYSSGNVTGTDYVGGLIGTAYYSTINISKSNSNVSANDYAGGLIGKLSGSTIIATVSNSYSNGTIIANTRVGGLVGIMDGKTTVTNSYSTASVLGNYRLGGLVGHLSSYSSSTSKTTVTNSYSSGYVRGSHPSTVGGLIGLTGYYYTVTNSFWDINTSGQTTSDQGIGKTSEEMKSQEGYDGLNFSTIWTIDEGETYPYLQNNLQTIKPTSVNPPAPIMIYTAEDLNNIRNDTSITAYYKLANDIDLNVEPYNTGEGWNPIGTDSSEAFSGILYGNGYKIKNLYINKPTTNNIGLFGYSNRYARFEDVILEDVNVIGQDYVGGIVGRQDYGLITRSNLTGNIIGRDYIGGISGYSSYAEISNSFSNITITAHDYVGGIAGGMYSGLITTSSSDSNISGNTRVGGLVGYAYGTHNTTSTISLCYTNGNVVGSSSNVGGLVGYVGSKITITDSYSTSTVTGTGSVGGLVGYMYSSISNLYTRVFKSYANGFISGNSNVGGLIGYSTGYTTITNNYWDMNTSGQTISSGGTGKTTEEMKLQETFTSWDFTTIWTINAETTYPYLRSNTQSPLPE